MTKKKSIKKLEPHLTNPEELVYSLARMLSVLYRNLPSQRHRISYLLTEFCANLPKSDAKFKPNGRDHETLLGAQSNATLAPNTADAFALMGLLIKQLEPAVSDNQNDDSDRYRFIIEACTSIGYVDETSHSLLSYYAIPAIINAVKASDHLTDLPNHSCDCCRLLGARLREIAADRDDMQVLPLQPGEEEDSSYYAVAVGSIAFTIGRAHLGKGPNLIIENPNPDINGSLFTLLGFLADIESEIESKQPDWGDDDGQTLVSKEAVFHPVEVDSDVALRRIRDELGDPEFMGDESDEDLRFATLVICESGTARISSIAVAPLVDLAETLHAVDCGDTKH